MQPHRFVLHTAHRGRTYAVAFVVPVYRQLADAFGIVAPETVSGQFAAVAAPIGNKLTSWSSRPAPAHSATGSYCLSRTARARWARPIHGNVIEIKMGHSSMTVTDHYAREANKKRIVKSGSYWSSACGRRAVLTYR